ncbi:MAG: S-layer homology domain-containing protein, partial [Clostridia bacterium]|nr:S-layer homology domain-containing protein [Clostridia bacterium]
ELYKYQNLIGYSISESSTCLEYSGSAPSSWLVRTPLYTGESGSSNDQAAKIKMDNGSRSSTRDMSNALRPVFFLDKDFFATVKIDSTGVGSAVKAEMLAQVGGSTEALMEMGYSLGDLINMGLIESDDSIMAENVSLTYEKTAPGYSLTIEYDFSGSEDKSGTMLRWYISDDGSDWAGINGENGRTYTVKNADSGKYIKASVRLKTTDGKYGSETDTPSVKIDKALASPPNSMNRIEGHSADTPKEYLIALTNGTKLSLLDCQETDGGFEYFVTTNESSGTSPVKTVIFDPENEDSTAYALENFMYKSDLTDTEWADWSGSDTYTCTGIDATVKKHILPHEFVTEASSGAGINNDYSVNAHIALMSYNEFVKYYDRFGYYISSGNYWVLRSARADGKPLLVDNTTSDPSKNGRITSGAVGGTYKIRPVFWLDEDFFTDVKLTVEQTGSEVKKLIVQNYTREEMKLCGYTDAELSSIGFENAAVSNLSFEGAFEVEQEISVSYTYTNSHTSAVKNQRYEWYRADSTNGVFERIDGATGGSYVLTDADNGKYIKAVVIPLTSFMTDGTSAELVSKVAVRSAPEYIVTADSTGCPDGAESVAVDFTVKKLSEGTGAIILTVSVFDGEGNLVAIAVDSKDAVAQGENSYSVSADGFEAEDGYYVKVLAIDSITNAKPILTKIFGTQESLMRTDTSDVLTLTKDRITGRYDVQASVGGTEYKSAVSMIVTDSDGGIIYADYAETAEGKLGAEFMMPKNAKSGEYTLTVGSYDGTAQNSTFNYVSIQAKAQLIAKLQADIIGGAAKDSVVKTVGDNKAVLELENSSAAPLGTAKLTAVYGDLYDYIKENGISEKLNDYISANDITADFDAFVSFIENNDSAKDFADIYYRCLSVYALANSTEQNAAKVMSEFSSYYGFESEKCYPVTQNKWFNSSLLAERMAGGEYTSIADIKAAYNEQVFLEGIHLADDYNYVMTMFEKYAADSGISTTYYDMVGAADAAVEIVGESFGNKTELEDYLESVYEAGWKKGGSGGGGGAVSGGITVSSDIYNANQTAKSYTTFNDLEGAVWAAEAIEYLAEKGIVSGYEDGTFRPNDTLTREAFTKMLVDAKGLLDSTAECDYTDVTADFWAYRYIASAKNNAIVSGMGDGTFGTGLSVTRQDMAVMLARAAGLSAASECDFTDFAYVSDYAKNSVSAMKQNGIINGYEDGTFRPQSNATRAEAAKIIYDMLKGGLL